LLVNNFELNDGVFTPEILEKPNISICDNHPLLQDLLLPLF